MHLRKVPLEIHGVVQQPENAHRSVVGDDVKEEVTRVPPLLPYVERQEPASDVVPWLAEGWIPRDRHEGLLDQRPVDSGLLRTPPTLCERQDLDDVPLRER